LPDEGMLAAWSTTAACVHTPGGDMTPKDKLEGCDKEFSAKRHRRLEAVRARRRLARKKFLKQETEDASINIRGETEAGSAGEEPAKG